ncbi:MAG: accessory factor UbiK family protein [Gammaproteobacteria bacterium]|nr:accessory factor UbiK family protein [Gammaproteobacteria bacterium]MDH5595015.1 accessory factor UbiK family protein [Gammaproteobacteria bacterium]
MLNSKIIDELVKRVADALPKELRETQSDIEKNIRSLVEAALEKMDLVTREEFDTQVSVLARSRNKIEELEKQVAELEKQLLKK